MCAFYEYASLRHSMGTALGVRGLLLIKGRGFRGLPRGRQTRRHFDERLCSWLVSTVHVQAGLLSFPAFPAFPQFPCLAI